MKRSKRLYTLLGILAVVCVAAFAVIQYDEKQEEIKNSDEIILEVDSENVTALSWEYDATALSFYKDETWAYDGDDAFPVDEEKIEELLSIFEQFGVSFVIENVEDYAQYGLSDPECTINLETESESYEILVGDYSSMDSERYISIGDGNVYLVSEDPMDTFEIALGDMIDHDETPDFDAVSGVTFTGNQDYQISYVENSTDTYCEDDVYFTEKGGKNVPLDTENVESYLDAISSLNLKNYVTYKVTEEELESYGLISPELTVNVNYTVEDEESEEETEATFTFSIGRNPEEVEKADEDEAIPAYIRVAESNIVYELTTSQYEELIAASYNDLRHEEILSADFADINQIDISLEGEDYTIIVKGDADDRTYYYGEEELEIGDFESALTLLAADEFTDEAAAGKEEISLTVHLDNKNHPEVKIVLYRQDGSYCLAEVDGEPVALVERTLVVDLVEAVNGIVLN